MLTSKQTNGLISEVALVNLILFFLVMPTLIRTINKHLESPLRVLDLGIVRASLSLLFIGSLLLAFAPNSAFLIAGLLPSFSLSSWVSLTACNTLATLIYALGFGARSTLLSLITSWIDPQRAGTLYSAVFLVEKLGMLVGEPLVQNLLGVGIGLHDPWKGLPFMFTGVSSQAILTDEVLLVLTYCTELLYLISLICAFAMQVHVS